jgi:hypothetical protein
MARSMVLLRRCGSPNVVRLTDVAFVSNCQFSNRLILIGSDQGYFITVLLLVVAAASNGPTLGAKKYL